MISSFKFKTSTFSHQYQYQSSKNKKLHLFSATVPKFKNKLKFKKTQQTFKFSKMNVSTLTELQTRHNIKDAVEVAEGNQGLPKVILKHSSGSSAEIYLFGACITSWKQANGSEILYVRPDAKFDKSKGISGGIPICFPQFGPSQKMRQHGFARDSDWTITSTSADVQADEQDPEVELVLESNDETKKEFPFNFKVVYTVCLHGEELRTDFRVMNLGNVDFEFTGALHGYFEVDHVSKAKVKGLKGLKTFSKVPDPKNPVSGVMEDEFLTFPNVVDKIFLDAPNHVELDVGTGAAISLDSSGWKDVVCWNPWTEIPAAYEHFVCVENANYNKVVVKAGDSWRGTTNYQVIDL